VFLLRSGRCDAGDQYQNFFNGMKTFQCIGSVIITCDAAYMFLLNNCKFVIVLKFPMSGWQFILCNTLQELICLLFMLCDILIMSLSFAYKVKLVVIGA
jgi:hypothetical protein